MSKTLALVLLSSALAGPAAAASHKEASPHPPKRAHSYHPAPKPAPPPVTPAPSMPADAPPGAKPGQCFARLQPPPRVEIYHEQVLVEPERVEQRPIPPRFEPRTREVILRPEERRTVHTPPLYETRSERVLVEPGREERIVDPAKLATVTERVPLGPPRLVWKPVSTSLHAAPVWCLVEEPAPSEVHARTVVVAPERVRVVSHPPRYDTVTRQVLARPGETREIVVPAVVKTEVYDELIEPPRTEEVRRPARYARVDKSRLIESAPEWARVLCEAEATPHRIKAIQAALAKRGYYKGKADGLYGPATADALTRFQRDQRLPHQGFLSFASLFRLGVTTPA